MSARFVGLGMLLTLQCIIPSGEAFQLGSSCGETWIPTQMVQIHSILAADPLIVATTSPAPRASPETSASARCLCHDNCDDGQEEVGWIRGEDPGPPRCRH